MKRTHLSSAIGLVLGLALVAPLQAQQTNEDASAKPTAAKQAEAKQLQEVTVSARRRDESLEKVPVAVTATAGPHDTPPMFAPIIAPALSPTPYAVYGAACCAAAGVLVAVRSPAHTTSASPKPAIRRIASIGDSFEAYTEIASRSLEQPGPLRCGYRPDRSMVAPPRTSVPR